MSKTFFWLKIIVKLKSGKKNKVLTVKNKQQKRKVLQRKLLIVLQRLLIVLQRELLIVLQRRLLIVLQGSKLLKLLLLNLLKVQLRLRNDSHNK
jgi:hypothetical protein